MSVIIFLVRDFLRPSSPLFSPLPSTKPVLFIPGPGSQNQMFGLASVHNGQLGLQIFLGSHLVWFSAYIILRILADKLWCPYQDVCHKENPDNLTLMRLLILSIGQPAFLLKGYLHLAAVSWNTRPANTSRRCSTTSPCFAVNIQILLWLVIRSGSQAIIPMRTGIELISILKTHTIVFSHPADGENRFTRLCLSASYWLMLIGRFSIGQSNLPLARCGSWTQNFALFL